jgi:hypothetical protein
MKGSHHLKSLPNGKQTLNNISGSKDKSIERYLEDFTDEDKDSLLKRLRAGLKKQKI